MRLSTVLALAAALLWPRPAQAEDAREAAERLFQEGRELAADGQIAAACMRFEESRRLYSAAGVLLNLGHCHEQLGQFVLSLQYYDEALAQLDGGDERAVEARKRRQDVQARIATLVLELAPSAPAGTRVRVSGEEVVLQNGTAELPLDPKIHAIEVTAPNRQPENQTITLAEGERRTLLVRAGVPLPLGSPAAVPRPAPQGTAPPRPASMPSVPIDRSGAEGEAQTIAGYVVGATGVAFAITWAVTGILYLEAQSTVDEHCSEEGICTDQSGVDAAERGKTLGVVNTVSAAAALGLTAVGLILVLTAPEDDAVGVSLRLGPTGAGAVLRF